MANFLEPARSFIIFLLFYQIATIKIQKNEYLQRGLENIINNKKKKVENCKIDKQKKKKK